MQQWSQILLDKISLTRHLHTLFDTLFSLFVTRGQVFKELQKGAPYTELTPFNHLEKVCRQMAEFRRP